MPLTVRIEQALPSGWNPALNPYIAATQTDWMDVITQTGVFQRHTVTLTGGTNEFSNRLSLTLVGTFNEQYQLRYNASYQLNRYMKIREDSWVTTGSNRGANTGVIFSAMAFPRNTEAYYSDGTLGGTAPKDPAYIEQHGDNYANRQPPISLCRLV